MMSNKASADALSGTFDMSGIVTITTTTTTWKSDVSPNPADVFTLSGGGGSFGTTDGQNGISPLNTTTEPTGTMFTAQQFITFDVDSSLPKLDIDYIYAGGGGTADCTAPAVPGEMCTPSSLPYLTFTDDSDGSTMTFEFSGVTADGLSDWTAIFTSQFNVPYQTVLSDFDDSGSFSNSYSAIVDVTQIPPVVTPEPPTWLLLSTALGLAAFWRKLSAPVKP